MITKNDTLEVCFFKFPRILGNQEKCVKDKKMLLNGKIIVKTVLFKNVSFHIKNYPS